MPHTHSRYQQDLGFTDGRLLVTPNELVALSTAGSWTLTRINPGDYSWRAANSTTGTIAVNATEAIMRRLGFFEDTMNAFGSTFGSGVGGFVAGPSGNPGSGVPGSAEPQGRPDTIGVMAALQEITPRTALKVKGFKLNSFDVIYTVSSANLTAITTRVDSIRYVNGAAIPGATSVLASGVNGLSLVNSANAIVINVPIPAPVYSTLSDFALWIEVAFQTPGGGTADLRGIELAFEYNFN